MPSSCTDCSKSFKLSDIHYFCEYGNHYICKRCIEEFVSIRAIQSKRDGRLRPLHLIQVCGSPSCCLLNLPFYDLHESSEDHLLITHSEEAEDVFSTNSKVLYDATSKNPQTLTFLQLNVRSIRQLPKLDEIRMALLSADSNNFVLCLCKTWLDNSFADTYVNIPFYHCFRKDRGGNVPYEGLVCYVTTFLSASRRADLEIEFDVFEVLVISFKSKKRETVLLISMYRPPDTTHQRTRTFLPKMELVSMLEQFDKLVIIGNINIDSSKGTGAMLMDLQSFQKRNDIVEKARG